MAISVVSSSPRKRRPGGHDLPTSESTKARLFLALACFWPICLLVFYTASTLMGLDSAVSLDSSVASPHRTITTSKNIGLKFRDVLDRVDIMGYGPTHPRVVVVIVGDDKDNLVRTLESVFANTDMNRIFLAVVVVDGLAEDAALTKELKKIDKGTIPHWHGLRPDIHSPGQKDDGDPHGQKVHVLFNEDRLGLEASRRDAVKFIEILEKSHEESELKSEAEDFILLLLQSGAELTSPKWLGPVTEALIVPPPILGKDDSNTVAMKLANAVSFNLEGPGKRTSFDATFTPVISEPTPAEISLSNGDSYPTPALNGAAIAMRLDTYLNLPSQDWSLQEAWPANLDLALNLWLCADGIDMLKDVEVTAFERSPPAPLPPDMAARFAAAWMDELTQKKFFNAYTKSYPELTYLEWETYMSTARAEPHFSRDLTQKCRSFQWYVEYVNTDLSDLLNQSEEVQRNEAAGIRVSTEGHDADLLDKLPDKPLPVPKVKDDDEEEGGPDLSVPLHKEKSKPTQPLCEECLEIVQKAQPIDITFVDVSGGYKEHPHLGARDENGNFGYVHDETALHLHPPPSSVDEDALRSQCLKRDNNYKMLNEKVYVDLEYDKQMEASGKPRDKIFCLVYTTDASHSKLPSIRETWGPKCDGFMVASNKTDASIGAVDIPHEGPEEYNNIWQKVRSIWSYVYDNYYTKYDWFHIGGDDLFLIVENLRYYLESEEIKTASNGGIYLPDGTEKEQIPLFLGRRFAYQGNMDEIFNSGGSGYTINKAALKRLVVDGLPNNFPHAHTFSEDTMTARILRKYGVYPYETKDENGGERYMPFMPGHHYGYRMPKDHSADWYAKYSINIKEGADHCAARSVAFHYVKGDAMCRMHALLYHLCPADTL